MKCPYLKPDPNDPDCYICGKIIGACYCEKPRECPAFKRLLAQIFDNEKENN